MRVQSSGQVVDSEDAHVVAGARAMMKYRRTRTSMVQKGIHYSAQQGPSSSGRNGAKPPPGGWHQWIVPNRLV